MSNKNNADNLSLDSWLKKKCTEMFLKVCLVFRGHAPSALQLQHLSPRPSISTSLQQLLHPHQQLSWSSTQTQRRDVSSWSTRSKVRAGGDLSWWNVLVDQVHPAPEHPRSTRADTGTLRTSDLRRLRASYSVSSSSLSPSTISTESS